MKIVRISDYKCNYLKDDGTYLLDEHVYDCYDFNYGYSRVYYKYGIENFISLDGKTLFKNNVNECRSFKSGFARVKINNKWYNVDTECNFYDDISFKELYKKYPQKRQELIEIINKYTYHDIEEYFNEKETISYFITISIFIIILIIILI